MGIPWPVPQIDPDRCHGCGLCVKACAHGVLCLRAGEVIIERPQACRYDGCCEQICPEQAITRPFRLSSPD